MRVIPILLLAATLALSCQSQQISDKSIDNAIAEGNYTSARQLIKHKIATQDLTPAQRWSLNAKIQTMDRIEQDFTKDDTTIIAYIKEIIPEVTNEQIACWEGTGALECKVIDGKKRYFWGAARNLFRIDKGAKERWDKAKGIEPDDLDLFKAGHIPPVVAQTKGDQIEHLSNPQKMRITYTLTVKPNEVPEGETIRVWMPYPRENRRCFNVRLVSTSNENYIISPDEYPHKSIYMESVAVKDSATKFSYQLELQTYDHWFNINPDDIKPYDTESGFYKKFTAERETHLIFNPELRRITDSLIAGESNPYHKVVRIFDFISENIPWASAREYATIGNIPEYVLKYRHGDCGQVGLTFITMARYAGIPAKWQSGFVLHPGQGGMHDWSEVYFEGIGWVPVDASFGLVKDKNERIRHFYVGGIDSHRYYVNEDFSGDLYPAKIHLRSETVDFQRGEVEWKGENLYFDRWGYRMRVEYL